MQFHRTALAIAADCGHVEVIELLLSRGADVSALATVLSPSAKMLKQRCCERFDLIFSRSLMFNVYFNFIRFWCLFLSGITSAINIG